MKRILIAVIAAITLSSCTHSKVDVDQINDSELTCSQIKTELEQLKDMKKDIYEKRGFSGRNVGMALVFWPGIIVNEMNGSEAEDLVKQRTSKLVKLHAKKGCK